MRDVRRSPNSLLYESKSKMVKRMGGFRPDMDTLERLKVLIDSSTPIVVMETVEEMRAVRLVRAACASLSLAAFEWTIASGLVRCGSDSPDLGIQSGPPPAGGGPCLPRVQTWRAALLPGCCPTVCSAAVPSATRACPHS